MRPPAFAAPGRWFRGNLHAHSDRSDGVAPPEQVTAEYRAAGYDFLVLTDHFEARWGWAVTDTSAARDDGFTTPLGAELEREEVREAGMEQHVGCAGIGGAGDAGGVADWDDEHVFWVNAIRDLQRQRRPLVAGPAHVAVGDDAHWHHPRDRFAAWVEVRAERLAPDALLEALRAGAYCSTQGPRIEDVRADGDHVQMRCSPARAVALTGIHGWRSAVAEGDPTITEATLDLGRLRSPYWRLTVTAEDSARAWTNPVWT